MICTLNLGCPYCKKCSVAYDSDTEVIVLNPDTVRQKSCEHLCYLLFLSSEVDFYWLNPVFPQHSEAVNFFAKEVRAPTTLTELRTPWEIQEKSIPSAKGKKKRRSKVGFDEPDEMPPPEEVDEHKLGLGDYSSNKESMDSANDVPEALQNRTLYFRILWSPRPGHLASELKPLWLQWRGIGGPVSKSESRHHSQ
jgi:hypothetical protein